MNYDKLAVIYEKTRELDNMRREIDAEREAEIARLREAIRRLADHDATLSVVGGSVIVEMESPCPYVTGTVTKHCTLTPLRLTDAEREAVELAYSRLTADKNYADIAATLRGLLERTK